MFEKTTGFERDGTSTRVFMSTNPLPWTTNILCDIAGIVLGWPVSTNRAYDVEASEFILPPDWQRVPGLSGMIPSSGWLIITNEIDGVQRIWRLRVGLPEKKYFPGSSCYLA